MNPFLFVGTAVGWDFMLLWGVLSYGAWLERRPYDPED